MPGQFRMDDYVPVNERIDKFYEAYPEGSLQSELVELTASRVTFKAYAYRTPADERPGIGHSSLEIPGSTPYTRGSEIENAETSAWGRAIAALGFEVKRGIASHEEVRNKQGGQGNASVPTGRATPQGSAAPAHPQYRRAELAQLAAEKGLGFGALEQYATLVGVKPGGQATDEQMDRLIDAVRGHGTDEPLVIEQPEPAAPPPGDEAPAEPPRPGTEAYKALSQKDKPNARAFWAQRDAEERQPEPINPEQTVLPVEAA